MPDAGRSDTAGRSRQRPPQPDHLQIAVRYQPAAAEAQVGGDWYDAFVLAGGATLLVIGDVAGHDRDAAATMAQVRNGLRGVAHCFDGSPASVLSALDRALRDLCVDALATAVLARVEQPAGARAVGERVLRWSNAGHPPPLLVRPDGTVELLAGEPDLLLGLDPDAVRGDHTAVLPPGSTVLLYTDGLVERRGASIDDGIGVAAPGRRGPRAPAARAAVRRTAGRAAGHRRGRRRPARAASPPRGPCTRDLTGCTGHLTACDVRQSVYG